MTSFKVSSSLIFIILLSRGFSNSLLLSLTFNLVLVPRLIGLYLYYTLLRPSASSLLWKVGLLLLLLLRCEALHKYFCLNYFHLFWISFRFLILFQTFLLSPFTRFLHNRVFFNVLTLISSFVLILQDLFLQLYCTLGSLLWPLSIFL
jgi:hypothetical protein